MTLSLIRQRPGELPVEVTGFVGRQRELALLGGLHDPDLRPHTVALTTWIAGVGHNGGHGL